MSGMGAPIWLLVFPWVLVMVLVESPDAQLVPRITLTGDKSAGPAEPGSSKTDVMQSLLNWGIEHSDPEKLKELMAKYQSQNLTIKDVYGEDVLDALFVNEGELMQNMTNQLSDFANPAVTDESLEVSLTQLLELVEQVDNAGNLHQMGGLQALLDLAVSSDNVEVVRNESVRTLALWTLGVALQNNPPVQDDLIKIGGLPLLLGRLPLCNDFGLSVGEHDSRICLKESSTSAGNEYCVKLVFAISGLVKNNEKIQSAADAHGLFDWLLYRGIRHQSSSIAKKSLGLLDIVLSQNSDLGFTQDLSNNQDPIADSLLHHIRGSDLDGVEKGIRLVNRFLSFRPMLFRSSFSSEFSEAVAAAIVRCKDAVGDDDDEFCLGLSELANIAKLALTARDLSDDEL